MTNLWCVLRAPTSTQQHGRSIGGVSPLEAKYSPSTECECKINEIKFISWYQTASSTLPWDSGGWSFGKPRSILLLSPRPPPLLPAPVVPAAGSSCAYLSSSIVDGSHISKVDCPNQRYFDVGSCTCACALALKTGADNLV